jgi:hypothetical protein
MLWGISAREYWEGYCSTCFLPVSSSPERRRHTQHPTAWCTETHPDDLPSLATGAEGSSKGNSHCTNKLHIKYKVKSLLSKSYRMVHEFSSSPNWNKINLENISVNSRSMQYSLHGVCWFKSVCKHMNSPIVTSSIHAHTQIHVSIATFVLLFVYSVCRMCMRQRADRRSNCIAHICYNHTPNECRGVPYGV